MGREGERRRKGFIKGVDEEEEENQEDKWEEEKGEGCGREAGGRGSGKEERRREGKSKRGERDLSFYLSSFLFLFFFSEGEEDLEIRLAFCIFPRRSFSFSKLYESIRADLRQEGDRIEEDNYDKK